MNNTQTVFLELVKAGLWGNGNLDIRIDGTTDWQEVYRLATEQSVIGLVLAGLEHSDVKPPQVLLLQWIGEVQMIEQRNKAMNAFVAETILALREQDIYALLVKGQGIAQCYERPLWRACGDIDLYLSESCFSKAKHFFRPLVNAFDPDNDYTKHINMQYDPWVIEIHADQHCGLSFKIDAVLDEIHNSLFSSGEVRTWNIDKTTVYLPSPDNDILIVFTHFLKHFYCGGLGLRQVCDWIRLLWKYKDVINYERLQERLRRMGLTTEWKAFASLAVDFLGMPKESMPFYSIKKRWRKKAKTIFAFIFEVGNMGHNRDSSYFSKYPRIIRKAFSLGRRLSDLIRHLRLFPLDSFRFLPSLVYNGIKSAARGE